MSLGLYIKEIERLKDICRDIADVINTSPYLYQEPVNYDIVLRKIEDLAVSGYDPNKVLISNEELSNVNRD